ARLDRTVAIKLLRADHAPDPGFQARFRREAQSAASLNHRAVVAVYDTGDDPEPDGGSIPFIVMEYVEGTTLRDLLGSGRRLLPERALEIVDGILGALDYSHRHGIVHRDIKPANVMLTRSGDVKVMDFGIARALSDVSATMTQTSAVIGTAQYLSPEQARGEAADARSDLYATGCLLYELLTGRPPFIGDSPVAVAYAHVNEAPPPPSSLDPDISPSLDAIVLKALAKDRADRYQSAAEMRVDVERALRGIPVAAPTPVVGGTPTMRMATVARTSGANPGTEVLPVNPSGPAPRRHTGTWVVLGVLALAVLVLGGIVVRLVLAPGTAGTVTVPNVVGLTRTTATTALADHGLKVTVTSAASQDQPPGTVTNQSPTPGNVVRKGTTVDLTVSAGAGQVAVPPVTGMSLPDAQAALAQVGLTVGTIKATNSSQPANQVLSASPPPGVMVQQGSKVNLVVASGMISVPNVVGQSEAQATATLTQVGLVPSVLHQPVSGVSAGIVAAQAPQPAATASTGSTVVITVSTGSPSPTTSPSGSPSSSPTSTPTTSATPGASPTPTPTASP
ncbi:MAG: Stk1 family PASTA domain-containing Ser/Thr kinase, partial [Actinomycetes bacterium]